MIACDVDGVLLDFYGNYCKVMGLSIEPLFDWDFEMDWSKVSRDHRFWSNLEALVDPSDIKFKIDYFITALPESMKLHRIKNLKQLGFDASYSNVIITNNKLESCEKLGVTTFIDDKPKTVKSFENSPIDCIQFMPYYAAYQAVTNTILYSLEDFVPRIPMFENFHK